MTVSGTTSDKELQPVVQRKVQLMTTSDSKCQWLTASDIEWYNKWKRDSTLKRMDDWHSFYDIHR